MKMWRALLVLATLCLVVHTTSGNAIEVSTTSIPETTTDSFDSSSALGEPVQLNNGHNFAFIKVTGDIVSAGGGGSGGGGSGFGTGTGTVIASGGGSATGFGTGTGSGSGSGFGFVFGSANNARSTNEGK